MDIYRGAYGGLGLLGGAADGGEVLGVRGGPAASGAANAPRTTNSYPAPPFITGFGSSMLFGTIVRSLVDKQGRMRACVPYCISYILSSITKHSPRPQYKILMIGRVLGGTATSLLFSAFESCLVAEHNKGDGGRDQDYAQHQQAGGGLGFSMD